jgi:hypothetical protein
MFCKRAGRGRCATALDEFCSRAEEPVAPAVRYFWLHAEGRASMRPEKSFFNAVLTHFLMGVTLGLTLVLLLGLTDAFHVRDLVAKSDAPVQTTLRLVTTYGLMFGIGAALTGLVLTLEDDS